MFEDDNSRKKTEKLQRFTDSLLKMIRMTKDYRHNPS